MIVIDSEVEAGDRLFMSPGFARLSQALEDILGGSCPLALGPNPGSGRLSARVLGRCFAV